MFKINKKIILFIVVLTIFAFVFYWQQKQNNNEISEVKTEPKKEEIKKKPKKKISYSRVTFFHHFPVKASLAIPETWEGKYRLEEKGNEVLFYYIGDINNPKPLFKILAFKEEDWNNFEHKSEFKKIKSRQPGYVFAWQKQIDKISNSSEYFDMIEDINDIINSFRDFKL